MKNETIAAVQCPQCLTIVFSRARHDFRTCFCKGVSIDGGTEYTRLVYHQKFPYPITLELVGGLTTVHLFNDWNDSIDKFGFLRTRRTVYDTLYRYTINVNGKMYRYIKRIDNPTTCSYPK